MTSQPIELTTEEPQKNLKHTWQLYWFHATDPDASYRADAETLAKAGFIPAEVAETERMRLAACGVAALGYHKPSDPMHPSYDSAALRDVMKLYTERGDLLTKVKATEAELAEARAIGAALALEVNKVDDNLRAFVDWPIVKQLSRRALAHLSTEPPSKNSTGSGAADAEPRETSAEPGSAPSAPEPSWNAVAPGVERTGHSHTCINTATTVDGRPPPPCAACHADPEFTALLDVHNLGFGAGELARIPPPPAHNVDPSPWVPEVGDRVLCRQNQIGTIERIAPGASLNIWVKFDNAATCNYSASELQRVRRLPPPAHFVTVETLLAALDEVAGEAGYGGPVHFVFRNLADQIRERTKP